MRTNSLCKFTIFSLIAFLLLVGCSNSNSSGLEKLTDDLRLQIEMEIRKTVEDYLENVKSKNLEGILSFWSDSEDFVHAGDGSIFGGYEEWSNWLINRNKSGVVEKWLYWNNSDIHVIVLDKNAAAYTTNLEMSFISQGDTTEVTGSWTYVFRRTEAGWKVITSNGTHVGLSYENQ